MNSGKTVLSRMRSDLDDGRFARVLARCERLLATGRRHPVLWSYRGRALEGLQRDSDALAIYRDASLRFPHHAQSRLLLGKLCARLGQHEEAQSSLEQALQLDPELIDGYRSLLNYRAIAPDDTAVAHIRARARSTNSCAAARARALFMLGQIHVEAGLDRQGFEYYRDANGLVASTLGNGSREYVVANNTQKMDAELLREFRRSDHSAPACPAVLITGLPRSGKSLAEALLARHPRVLAGGELALVRKFASTQDTATDLRGLARTLSRQRRSSLAQWYAQELTASGATRVNYVVDTSPANLTRLGHLALLHPEVPIVFCRRDPLDLGASLYFKNFRTGHHYSYSLGTLGRAIAAAEKVMDHWLAALPNPMLELRYEQVVMDPDHSTRLLHHHLGLDPLRNPAPAPAGTAAAARLFPSRANAGFNVISTNLVGFGQRFRQQLEPMLAAYAVEMQRPQLVPTPG